MIDMTFIKTMTVVVIKTYFCYFLKVVGGRRGWGVATACGSVSHGRGRSARPRPCPAGGGPDGQAGGVRFPVLAGGFSGPAVLFRTLPVTPVATRVWLSQTAGSFLVTSRCCADFRPCLEGGALPTATYHPLDVRPSNGYPSLGRLPNAPSRSAGQTASGAVL